MRLEPHRGHSRLMRPATSATRSGEAVDGPVGLHEFPALHLERRPPLRDRRGRDHERSRRGLPREAVARGVPEDLEALKPPVSGQPARPRTQETGAEELVLCAKPLDPLAQDGHLDQHRAAGGGAAPAVVCGGDDPGDGDEGLEHRGRVGTRRSGGHGAPLPPPVRPTRARRDETPVLPRRRPISATGPNSATAGQSQDRPRENEALRLRQSPQTAKVTT